jgi:glycosyltransferase involved in cell wall biosynthesis
LIYAEDFAPAFSQLANPDELSSIGAAARRTAEHFSWAHHTDQLLELYAKVRT